MNKKKGIRKGRTGLVRSVSRKKIQVCVLAVCLFFCVFSILFSGEGGKKAVVQAQGGTNSEQASPLQASSQDAVRNSDLYRHVPSDFRQILYNQESGLGSSEINCVFQTQTGYVWIGTDGGLYRYDGSSFTIYNLWDTEKEDVYFINSLFQDSSGRLWVSTNNYGLFYIQGSSIGHFTEDYYHGVKSVRNVTEDRNGTLYAATPYGVYTLDVKNRQMKRIPDLAGKNVIGIASAGSRVWGISRDNQIFTIDTSQNVVTSPADSSTSDEFTCIAASKDTVYIGTNGRDVLKMTDFYDTEVMRSGLDGTNYIYPYEDLVYLVSDSGAGYFYQNESGKRVFHDLENLDISRYFSSMMIDYEGNYWLSSSRSGILFLEQGKFSDLNEKYGIPSSGTNCIFQAGGNQYIGTDDGLVILNPEHHMIENRLTASLRGISVRQIVRSEDGTLWFAAYRKNGVIRYSRDGEILSVRKEDGLLTNLVNCLLVLSDGRVAVGTEDGVNILSKTGKVEETYNFADGLSYPDILALYEDADHRILAGSNGGGIYQIDNGKVTSYTSSDGLGSDVVTSFRRGSRGLWIGTDNGLSFYDGTFRAISQIDFSNNIYEILDAGSELCLIGSKGLLFVNEASLLGADDITERYYSTSDGLDQTFTVSSHNELDSDGNLYICCNDGLVSFQTKKRQTGVVPPRLTVTEVDVDGKIYYLDQIGGRLSVPEHAQRISISFAVLSFMNRDNIKVQYQLEGFDDATQTLTGNDRMTAVYTNLRGGSYTLNVSAVNGDGVSSVSEISFTIVKRLSFWERPIVRLTGIVLVILILFAMVWLAYRTRKKFIGKNQELENLAREHETTIQSSTARSDYLANMSNEIKIPVNVMIRTAEKMEQEDQTEAEKQKSLNLILKSGSEILNQIDETIQLARLESGAVDVLKDPYSITTLVCDVSDRMLKKLEDSQVRLLVDIGEKIPDILIGDYEKIKSILNIILDHAFEYTKEGSITLSVDCYETSARRENRHVSLIFSVSDTGTGIQGKEMPHIFDAYYREEGSEESPRSKGVALAIAKRLTDIMGGTLEVESTYGAGTTFTLSLMQEKPEKDVRPVPVAETAATRISREEADRMWAPDLSALLVDDEEMSRSVLLSSFHQMEIKCDTAASGVSAVDMVLNHQYDLIFLDIHMPVMNGIDTLSEIRSMESDEAKNVPVIAMTEDATGKNRGQLLSAGFSDVILKPFDYVQFAGIIAKFAPANRVKYRSNDILQYLTDSRYAAGLKKLNEHFDVVGTLERIGGNIDVYHRILSTFCTKHQGTGPELKEKFYSQYRQFRSRLHVIRTGCQNIGAVALSDLTLRMENAMNLGNRGYVRDHLDEMIRVLDESVADIQEYLAFVRQQKGLTDEEYAAEHQKEHSEEKVIDEQKLHVMQEYVLDRDMAHAKEILSEIASHKYVTEDMEFLAALKDVLNREDSSAAADLLTTYLDLKSH